MTGGIFFINREFSYSQTNERNFIIARGISKNLYNYDYPFNKGMKIIDICEEMKVNPLTINKIYVKKKRKWISVDKNEKIYKDIVIKVTSL